jgi:phosphoglycerol transferase MdoB-like AlkP superfamily enzyme
VSPIIQAPAARVMRAVHATRFIPLYWSVAIFVMAATATRLLLLALHVDDVRADPTGIVPAFLAGFAFDLFMAFVLSLPFALFLAATRDRWLASRPLRIFTGLFYLTHLFALIYLCVAEVVFFDEFQSRFNYIAVDYLIYPKEVFVNIRDTYPVVPVLIADAVATLLLGRYLLPRVDAALRAPLARGRGWRYLGAHALPVAAGALLLNVNAAQVSDNRVLNEIAGNGAYSFLQALGTNEVDYDTYYARMDIERAFTRVRTLIATSNAHFTHPQDPHSLEHAVQGSGKPRAMNVVLVLEESFGASFVGSLHPEGPARTPEFDRLARDGLYFTHVYATGNRTVRGIEAALTGLPPLPGRAIVKRPGGQGVFSLPSVFRAKGYQTAFIYGGRAYFDNIRDFALGNGYQRVIDQDSFPTVHFNTIWGVADEELFGNTLEELDRMHATGRPFFATLLTVSNHTPYTYPEGRIPENPLEQKRENAVKYADYAIGKFMRDARRHAFFDNTLFVFLADHGARAYGSQEIPLGSYEIPLLFYAPKLIPQGRRMDMLASQIDVAPTLLGLLDMDYNSLFYGRDLLRVPPDRRWALMTHNRDVGLLRGSHLVVLGIRGVRELWEVDPGTGAYRRLDDSADPELIDDAIAYFQTANRLYQEHRLKPLGQVPVTALPEPALLRDDDEPVGPQVLEAAA